MDLETAVRERLPILSILLNNSAMAIEMPVMPAATEKFDSTAISGNYTELAEALGLYAERVKQPQQIVPSIRRGIEQTQAGRPVLLEFITAKVTELPYIDWPAPRLAATRQPGRAAARSSSAVPGAWVAPSAGG